VHLRLDLQKPRCRSQNHADSDLPASQPESDLNQSNMVVTVETDIGITGIGEGGTKDLLEQSAVTMIGEDPFRSEAIWQEMYMAFFLSARAGEDSRRGSAGHGAVGYQGQGAEGFRCISF